jgi:alkylation response protein AidB-like acyl-CoA dehydrogenase
MGSEEGEMDAAQPSLAGFECEIRSFLSAYPPREHRRSEFRWGVGDDRVALFDETENEAEADHVQKVRAWRRSLADAGLSWITGPAEYGGRGLPRQYQRLFDTVSREYDVPDSAKLTVSLGMVAPTILAHGTDVARGRYLAAIHSGDLIGCQLFSEPGAGSDLAGISTRAAPTGDGWMVTGQKVWTSGAHFADIGLLLCKSSDGPRHHNLTAFVVDMHAPGVEVRPLRQMTGGAAFNEVFLDNVPIADDDRLGDADGGWQVARTTLLNERANIGGAGMGGSRLLDTGRLVAMVREFGRADDPATRHDFARLVVGLRSAQASRHRAEAKIRAGSPPGPELSLAKLALVSNLLRLSDFVADVLGPRLVADTGEWGTYSWSTFVLGVPGYRLGGGTDEILRSIVAERVLGLPRD